MIDRSLESDRGAVANGHARVAVGRTPSLAYVFLLACALRLAVTIAGGLVPLTPEAGTRPPLPSVLRNLPLHWDGSWYVGVASGGYRFRPDEHEFIRVAFFPAYPLALRGIATALPIPRTSPAWGWTGATLSTLCFAWATALLWKFVRENHGDRAALGTAALLASYPFAFFYGLPYTESVFLMSAVGAVSSAAARRAWSAALYGVLAGLSRPNGLLVSLFLALWWLGYPALKRASAPRRRRTALELAVVAAPAIGTATYSAYLWWLTGSPLTWLTAQDSWGRTTRSLWSVALEVWIRVEAAGVRYPIEAPFEAANLAAALTFLALVPLVYKRVGLPSAAFVAVNVVLPLAQGGVASAGRYTAVLFPVFVAVALTLPPKATWGLASMFCILQVAAAASFFADYPLF